MLALMLAGMLGVGAAFAAQAEEPEKDVLFTIWDGSGAVVHEAVRGAGEGPGRVLSGKFRHCSPRLAPSIPSA